MAIRELPITPTLPSSPKPMGSIFDAMPGIAPKVAPKPKKVAALKNMSDSELLNLFNMRSQILEEMGGSGALKNYNRVETEVAKRFPGYNTPAGYSSMDPALRLLLPPL